jgi:solute carrier family 26 (sodium-independent sulfate anion transporter), member 11
VGSVSGTSFTSSRSFCQFHFATILSPWIRRALIAGNFGTGAPCPTQEIAAVVPYRGGCKDSSEEVVEGEQVDVEAPPERRPGRSKPDAYGPNGDLMTDTYTPFFHFDLLAAVSAAEGGLSRRSALEGDEGSDSKVKHA